MTSKQHAVNAARYHSRMAVRSIRIWHDLASAVTHRIERDSWMNIARNG